MRRFHYEKQKGLTDRARGGMRGRRSGDTEGAAGTTAGARRKADLDLDGVTVLAFLTSVGSGYGQDTLQGGRVHEG